MNNDMSEKLQSHRALTWKLQSLMKKGSVLTYIVTMCWPLIGQREQGMALYGLIWSTGLVP